MKVYRTDSTITDAKQIVLSDIPFEAGERVSVMVVPTPAAQSGERAARLRTLFRETQSQSQIMELTDSDILRELEAHRNGQ
jgi:hypothetical protein